VGSPRILVVDDDRNKVQSLAEVIYSVEPFGPDNVDVVSDVVSAKERLGRNKYALVVLDINLPLRADRPTEVGGGLGVIAFLKGNNRAIQPDFILGMTAFDDGASVAEKEFSSPLWKLVRFSFGDSSWKTPLREALLYLVGKHRPPYYNDGRAYQTDMAIFVALEDVELQAALALPANWAAMDVDHDPTRYYVGSFECVAGPVSAILVAAPKMGLPTSAAIASKLIHNFRPQLLGVAGICAGVKGKTKIGDILVADPCFDWGSGKWVVDKKSSELRFQPAAYPWRIDEDVRTRAKGMKDDAAFLSRVHEQFSGKKPQGAPAVIVEAMGSGGSVLQATKLMDDVKEQHKNLIGVEMETYGVFTAAHLAASPRPTVVSMKSVSDYGNERKKDGYQEYAARTSVAALHHFAIGYFEALRSKT